MRTRSPLPASTFSKLLRLRLQAQRLSRPSDRLATPQEIVRWFGAVQAQDYLGAKWAIGQRVKSGTDAAVDAALDRGEILRTHVLRPTWHLVAREDLRWMLALTAPRVHAIRASSDRAIGLTERVFQRALATIGRALEGGRHLTRAEIGTLLAREKIATGAQQKTNIVLRAELDGLICSGPLRSKHHTYALMEDRAAGTPSLDRDDALANLGHRFFVSHGPATCRDFAWWSGLTLADAKRAVALASGLAQRHVDGQTYVFDARIGDVPPARGPAVRLLPNYDEFLVAYVDREVLLDFRHRHKLDARGNALFQNVVLLDGRVAGTWKRTLRTSTVQVTPKLFVRFDAAQRAALDSAAMAYARFLGRPLGE